MRTNGSRSVRHGESAIAAMTMACSKVCFAGQTGHSPHISSLFMHFLRPTAAVATEDAEKAVMTTIRPLRAGKPLQRPVLERALCFTSTRSGDNQSPARGRQRSGNGAFSG